MLETNAAAVVWEAGGCGWVGTIIVVVAAVALDDADIVVAAAVAALPKKMLWLLD